MLKINKLMNVMDLIATLNISIDKNGFKPMREILLRSPGNVYALLFVAFIHWTGPWQITFTIQLD